MSKLLTAACVGSVVSVNGLPVPGATVLSEGKGQSSGVAVLDEDRSYYIANTTPDLKTTLAKLIAVLGTVADGLTTCSEALGLLGDAGFIIGATGAVPWVPEDKLAFQNKVAEIDTAVTQITGEGGIVSDLNTLMGNLR